MIAGDASTAHFPLPTAALMALAVLGLAPAESER